MKKFDRIKYKRLWAQLKKIRSGRVAKPRGALCRFVRLTNYPGNNNDCWIWLGGPRNRAGYGSFKPSKSSPTAVSSRWFYEWTRGVRLRPDEFCCHKCDNTKCINPSHIFIGSQKENIRDAIQKNRHNSNRNSDKTHCPRGHKFTPENTKWMKHKYGRQCVECARAWARQRHMKKRLLGLSKPE